MRFRINQESLFSCLISTPIYRAGKGRVQGFLQTRAQSGFQQYQLYRRNIRLITKCNGIIFSLKLFYLFTLVDPLLSLCPGHHSCFFLVYTKYVPLSASKLHTLKTDLSETNRKTIEKQVKDTSSKPALKVF